MASDANKALIEEAADLFVRLREDPENAALKAERAAFLARGDAHKAAYAHVARVWEGSGRRTGPGPVATIAGLALVVMLGAAASVGYEPARIYMLADVTSDHSVTEVALASGDRVALDARSALRDDTEVGGTYNARRVSLLSGAAVFEVETDGRPFVVAAGPLDIEVLGTTFETALIDDLVTVGVEEGAVQVRAGTETWQLGAGDQLTWSDADGARLTEGAPDAVALWRADRFVLDGLSLAQAVSVLDRRLPGPVVITDAALGETRLSGTLDLSRPEEVLAGLVAASGGRVLRAGPLASFVIARP